ncbi:MAG: hypothetical protein K9H64_13005 [Bacteroidales bacterium]|nr:hypothetical protein [Bacteroidales bacterium]MCF8456567.1 hypothetical protein [Bacteroidales bacterium]
MTKNIKLNQDIVAELKSGNPVKVSSALGRLRTDGNVAYLSIIFDELLETVDDVIRKNISGFLNDLKDQQVVDSFIEAIHDQKYQAVLPLLISACWQNGLDFSDHAETFAGAFIKGSFIVSIEAFSVFDNMVDSISLAERNSVCMKLKSALPEMEIEKQKLARELISLLS